MRLPYHLGAGRGLLPAGLVAEIRVLDQPPLPWDVKLARWFDEHVPAAERRRTYARPSRRQAGAPDIPRPGWHTPEQEIRRCTFGVVVDTSGSMNHELMGNPAELATPHGRGHRRQRVRDAHQFRFGEAGHQRSRAGLQGQLHRARGIARGDGPHTVHLTPRSCRSTAVGPAYFVP